MNKRSAILVLAMIVVLLGTYAPLAHAAESSSTPVTATETPITTGTPEVPTATIEPTSTPVATVTPTPVFAPQFTWPSWVLKQKLRKIQVKGFSTGAKIICLTIDDVWDRNVDQVLDALDKADIKADLFCIWNAMGTEHAKALVSAGHELGNHGLVHKPLSSLNKATAIKQFTEPVNIAYRMTGQRIILYRAPWRQYGWHNYYVPYVDRAGLLIVDSSVNTLGYKGISTSQIVKNVERDVRRGSIIMAHVDPNDLAAIPIYAKYFKAKGYRFVVFTTLARYGTPTTNGKKLRK